MRWTLFEQSGTTFAVALDKVLHVLTAPPVFSLPLLKPVFVGGFLYQGQVVPLLSDSAETAQKETVVAVDFVLVCQAEFGLVGIPADRIVRITNIDEGSIVKDTQGTYGREEYEINGCDYRQLDLNAILDDPEFSICGLKD